MSRYLLTGVDRKSLLLELIPALGKRARGFQISPLLEKFQKVGYRMYGIPDGQAIVAHLRGMWGVQWGALNVYPERIDEIGTRSICGKHPADTVFVVDEISEIVLHSMNFQKAFQALLRSGASFIATVGDKPKKYVEPLRRMRGLTVMEVTPECRGRMKQRILRELEEGRMKRATTRRVAPPPRRPSKPPEGFLTSAMRSPRFRPPMRG